LFDLSTQQLALFHKMTDTKIPLIGVGGVSDVETAWAKICAGASLIQIYSALVYRGPSLVAKICEGLEQKLQCKGLANISAAVGSLE
jgi:dihydroorotate dehydrogenase